LNDSSTDTGAAEAIEQGGADGADDEHGNEYGDNEYGDDPYWGDDGYYDDGYDDLADDEGATAASLNDSSTDTGAAEAIEQGGAGGADDEHGNDEFWGDEYYDDDWNTDPADQDDAAHDSPSDADTATDGELTRDGGADDDDAHDRYWEYAYDGDDWYTGVVDGAPVDRASSSPQDSESRTHDAVPAIPVGEDPAIEDHENWAEEAGVTAGEPAGERVAVEAPVPAAEDDDLWTEEDWYNYYNASPRDDKGLAASEPLEVDVVASAHRVALASRDAVISACQLRRMQCLIQNVRCDWPEIVWQHPSMKSLAQRMAQLRAGRLAGVEAVEPGRMGRSILHRMATGLRTASRSFDSAAELISQLAGPEVEVGSAERRRR
jgi:hypothetical protein